MGTVVKEKIKGSGIWWLFVCHKGQRKSRKCGPGEKGKKLAEKLAQIVEANLMIGRPLLGNEEKAKPPAPTLRQYYKRFEDTYMKAALKESSFKAYESSFRVQILPALGDHRLDQIDRIKMEAFVVDLLDRKLSKKTIQINLAVLGVLYRQAIRSGLASENPTKDMGQFYRQAPATLIPEPLNQDESILFLKTAMEKDPDQYPVLLCGLHTGMRAGEISGLQWPDIDWSGSFFFVQRQIHRGKITTLKTKHARRKVDCSDDLLKTLKQLRQRRLEKWMESGSKGDFPEWVFCDKDGEPDKFNSRKSAALKRTLKLAGLRNIRFHDLRHTFASLLLAQGEPVTYVSHQLGHSSPLITMQVYAHWIPNESQRDAVNRLPSLGVAAGRF